MSAYLDQAPNEDVALLDMAELTARISGVPLWQILGKGRQGPIARARHVAVWATERRHRLGPVDLARLFGGREHSTVYHSLRAVQQALAGDAGSIELVRLARQVEEAMKEAS